jgi:glutamyl/glutaminyl-tRNA synthetase
LARALAFHVPAYYHCELVRDGQGRRLAKRHDALSIRNLRESGWTPEQVRQGDRDRIRALLGGSASGSGRVRRST